MKPKDTMPDPELEQTEKFIIGLRRHFHRYPEPGGQERETAERICRELESMGISCRRVGRHGVIGVLTGAHPGKTLVMRSDMDAVPVQESAYNLQREKTVLSEREGLAHVCGHDGHMAMLLGAARLLVREQSRLKGRVLFCFEEGAETVIGLQAMMDVLAGEKVDGVWGLCLHPSLPAGCFAVEEGARLAGAIGFKLVVTGKGGHGSRPDSTINPIDCSAQIIGDVQGMIAREINPYENVVLSFGRIEGGSISNMIPDTCTLYGTMRFFNREVGLALQSTFRRLIEQIAVAHRCQVSFDFFGRGMPVVNHPGPVSLARKAISRVIPGENGLTSLPPQMRSDTIGTYLNEFSGVLAFMGIDNEALGTGADGYTQKYDLDESCLLKGSLAAREYARLFQEWDT